MGFNEGQVSPRDLQTVLDKVTEFYGLHEDMREAHLTEEKVGKFVDILSGKKDKTQKQIYIKKKSSSKINHQFHTNKLEKLFILIEKNKQLCCSSRFHVHLCH